MTPEQWQQIDSVLQQVLDLPSQERKSFIAEVCEGDDELTREVSSLAEAYEESGDFIEQSALMSDAKILFSFGDSNIGSELGPYRIKELLGVGGMGEVYLADDKRLNRLVALKILPEYLCDEVRLNRFRKEARAASGLNHPNIITIHEVGEHDGVRFIATEFIDGETLRDLISRNELTPNLALEIAEQVCAALIAAHAAGIVHRDIKPENIMRRPDGIVKLLDFGIAKLIEPTSESSATSSTKTELGVVMGTVNYMSPEQARGLNVDERSDLWSLGVVIHEMLSSRLPFAAATRLDTMVAILEREPQPLSQGDAIQSILDKCLAKNTDDRYQSANELLADLKHASSTFGAQQIANPNKKTSANSRGRWVLATAIMAMLLIGVASGVMYRRFAHKSPIANPVVSVPKLYLQMNEQEQLAFIDREEQRISTLMGERPAKLNADALKAIKRKVDWYLKRPSDVSAAFERARPFLPTIGRSFRERKVPVIIGVYLPMIESAYKTCYENPLGSKGLFQFLPGTAELYGVPRNQMCDAEKMTPAAAHYMADRIAELGDDSQSLTLVLLSYTTGAEWVREALRKLRESGNYDRNFWTMFDKRKELGDTFQNEVAGYVPLFFAAAIIGENPEAFGLDGVPLSRYAEQ
jgi:serine/threonine protein kinase